MQLTITTLTRPTDPTQKLDPDERFDYNARFSQTPPIRLTSMRWPTWNKTCAQAHLDVG